MNNLIQQGLKNYKMKILLTVSMFLLANNILFSQTFFDKEADSTSTRSYNRDREYYVNNNLYLEGSFIIQSINFETKLYSSESNLFQLNGRLGLGYFYFNFFGSVTKSVGGLAGLAFLLGRKNNHFEASLGGIGPFAWPIATLGYKYQKPEGGFLFRSNIGTLGVGVGLGYAF